MKKRVPWLFLFAVMSWRCASIAPPGGGPEDKTPPVILTHLPEKDSVRVGRSSPITVEFSETMNRESVEKAVFISPPPSEAPMLSWHDRVLTIRLTDSLPVDRTCVVTIGTSAKDAHNNGLSRALSFAFSTGDSIDKGRIAGQVITEATMAVSILAYRLGPVADPDSEIHRRKADYVTQTDQAGRYELPFLATGTYRVFAMVDADEDGLYTAGTDGIGIPYRDVTLSDSLLIMRRLDMRMAVEDTAKFGVLDAMPLNLNTVSLAFNRAVFAPGFTEGHALYSDPKPHFELTDSNTGLKVGLRDGYVNTRNWADLRMLVDPLDTSHTYFLTVRNILSERRDTMVELRVRLQDVQGLDTGRVSPEWLLPDGTRPETILPNDPLVFRFDKGMNRSSFERHFSVVDTTQQEVTGTFHWWNSSYVLFVPERPYRSLMDYKVHLQGDSIRDWEGVPLSDTASILRFRSFKTDSLGSVTGRIEDDHPSAKGPFIVTCRSLTGRARGYSEEMAQPGPFHFQFVIPGKYVVAAFRDEDLNGTYSHGRTAPMVFSERFAAFADTVTVRPNWETSNVVIRFVK